MDPAIRERLEERLAKVEARIQEIALAVRSKEKKERAALRLEAFRLKKTLGSS